MIIVGTDDESMAVAGNCLERSGGGQVVVRNGRGIRILGVRLDPETDRLLEVVAAKQGRSKSETVREAIRRYLEAETFLEEARRQSLLASASADDRDTAEFAAQAADWGREPGAPASTG